MRKRRNMDGASLSFLDVMSCGFGAVVLLYLIINHNTEKIGQIVNQELLAALRVLDYQVLEGEKDLAEMVKKVDETKRKIEIAERQLIADKDQLEKQSDTDEEKPHDSAAKEPTLDDLKFEVESMEKDVKRLRAAEEANEGGRLLRIQGEGNRQYLTGLRIGGRNIAIAIDGSASMMDPSIVNVLRRRYQSDAAKRAAPKWNRAVRTVD